MFIEVFIGFVNKYAKKFKLKLAFLLILSTVAAFFEFAGLALIYTFMILLSENSINITNEFSWLLLSENPTKIAFSLGILVAVAYILKDLYMIFHINFQNSLLAEIANSIFNQNYAKFISQNYSSTRKLSNSDKLRILDNSITIIVNNFCGSVLSLIVNFIMAFAIIIYLFIKFQAVALVICILISAIWQLENKYFKAKVKKHGELLHKTQREKYDFVLSTVNAQKDIIVYNREDVFKKNANKTQKAYSTQNKIITTNSQLPVYLTEISVMGIFVFFLILLLVQNFDGARMSASLATIAAIVIRIVPIINRSQYCIQTINTSKVEVKWFDDTISMLFTENVLIKNTNKKLQFKDSIKFKKVNFCYEKNENILKDISFTIKKGEFVGIVGASGSGKTTLFNLICGLCKPSCGEIRVDSTKLNSKNIKMWQNNISILPQEYSLPLKTIWQNVALEPNAQAPFNKNKIVKALKCANIYEEIGGDINKNAQELSSGQKHRIALARAFYFEREVIMLDEATSALDVQTEDEISKTIENIKGEKTLICIAHRLKTIKNCDKIIYIHKGKIIDTATLKELESKYPSFKELIKLSQF